jgi:hypothetical protein
MDRFIIDNIYSVHLAAINAVSTTRIGLGVKTHHKRARYPAGRIRILFDAAKCSTTATTTHTDKYGFFGIARLQHKSNLFCLMEDGQRFLMGDCPAMFLARIKSVNQTLGLVTEHNT